MISSIHGDVRLPPANSTSSRSLPSFSRACSEPLVYQRYWPPASEERRQREHDDLNDPQLAERERSAAHTRAIKLPRESAVVPSWIRRSVGRAYGTVDRIGEKRHEGDDADDQIRHREEDQSGAQQPARFIDELRFHPLSRATAASEW